ncbi:putative ribonuclease H-like domain-containing protein [Tanacetum coccineum]
MVDEQINTIPSTESDEIKKSSVEILNPIPRESNDAKECEISIKGNLMESKFKGFENMLFEQNEEFSSYDESSSKVENKFDTFKCFSNPFSELDEEIITVEKDVFQNEFFDDLLNENLLPPDVSNVENNFQDNKEEIDISCDMIPPGIGTDDDSEGDVPPFEEPLDDVLFPLPKVDILPFKVEPVEVMFNYSHTYGENISQVERKFLSMVDDLFNLSNDDETFDPGGGENDVLLNKGENNDLNVFTIRTFLPFVTYPEVLPASYSTGSEDKVFKPGIFDNVLTRKSSLTLDVFDPLHPPLMDFHVTKAFFGFTFSLLKLFSKKFFEPGIKNATVFRILEASWFNIVEGQRKDKKDKKKQKQSKTDKETEETSQESRGKVPLGTSTQKEEISQDCIVMPIWKDASYFDSPSKDVGNGEIKSVADDQKQIEDGPDNENNEKDNFKLNTIDPSVSTASSNDQDSPKDMFKFGASHTLETTHVEFFSDEDEPEVDLGNITNSYTVPTTPNTRIHKDHPIKNVISNVKSSIQTRRMTKSTSEQGFLSAIYEQKTHDTLNTCLYACFLSQIEPTSIAKALSDSSWLEEIKEELLQFKLQQVWILVDLPIGKRVIGTKWVFKNKKDERGIVIRNKARLFAQGHREEEGIDYKEVFVLVARIEAIRLFLAYASFMGFLVYQMDVKSAFLYGTIEEEVYVTQPPGFKDPDNPNKVYKVVKALYGLHQAPKAWYETLANYLLGNGFKRGKLVQVYVDDIIFGSTNKELCIGFEKLMKDNQDKYVDEILKKFNYTDVKSASTPVDLEKPLVKDGDANDVDVHLYRSMIGSLMYLIASRPDIMFAVCACARFQVTPKTSHLLAVKRIFRYLKGKPTLGLWYSRDSPFELVAYTDSDYARATQDRKSITGAEYVAAASCCGQVLWIQNQLLDYGYNFMNTMIHIDNNSTICIIENPVQHSKTKHIEIRNHFIRDCNAKKLIQMVKIYTGHNVANLLTKGFDAGRFQYLVSSIGMLNS